MSKVSAIIPTLWKAKEFTDHLVNVLIEDESVGEIIIIDNAPTDFSYDNEKVFMLKQLENLYVYPSWNLGVEEAEYDKFIIFNDDIIIPCNFVSAVEGLLIPENGLIGIHIDGRVRIDSFNDKNITFLDREITLKTVKEREEYRVLVLSGHRETYPKIPENIRIWYGDDFLFNMNNHNYDHTYVIDNVPIFTKISATSDLPEFNEIKGIDAHMYKRIIAQIISDDCKKERIK